MHSDIARSYDRRPSDLERPGHKFLLRRPPASDEFLAGHVLRISGTVEPGNGNVRDNRGKAKQFTTVNGRIIGKMSGPSMIY